jgi:hypothetical protein
MHHEVSNHREPPVQLEGQASLLARFHPTPCPSRKAFSSSGHTGFVGLTVAGAAPDFHRSSLWVRRPDRGSLAGGRFLSSRFFIGQGKTRSCRILMIGAKKLRPRPSMSTFFVASLILLWCRLNLIHASGGYAAGCDGPVHWRGACPWRYAPYLFHCCTHFRASVFIVYFLIK